MLGLYILYGAKGFVDDNQDVLKGRCAHTGEKKQRQNKSDKNWVADDVIGYLDTYGYQLAIHLQYLLIADDKMQKENKKSCAGCILFMLK